MAAKQQDVIVLTGFGPFKDHPVNSSWEAVKLVPSPSLEAELNAQIVTQEIPVDYHCVSKMVPALWTTYNPTLVVHVGVSSQAKCITLESRARNNGYKKADIHNQKPGGGLCCFNGPIYIASSLDLQHVAHEVETRTGVKACTSLDAGKYLCEFTYYLSLNVDPSSAVFIHVPTLDRQKYSAEQLAAAIKVVIHESLNQAKKLRASKLVAQQTCPNI